MRARCAHQGPQSTAHFRVNVNPVLLVISQKFQAPWNALLALLVSIQIFWGLISEALANFALPGPFQLLEDLLNALNVLLDILQPPILPLVVLPAPLVYSALWTARKVVINAQPGLISRR